MSALGSSDSTSTIGELPPLFDKTGTLFKLSEHLKSWRERWFGFSVSRRTLTYFRSEKDFDGYRATQDYSLIGGTIQLANAWTYFAPYTERPYAFELSTLGKNYFLSGASEADMREWMTVLAVAGVAVKRHTKPKPGEKAVAYQQQFGMQGFLQKRGQLNSSFQRRFFRTMENAAGAKVLGYFDSYQDREPNGFIPLDGAKVRDTDPNSTEFEVAAKARVYSLKAESVEEKRYWIGVISALIDGSADKIFDVSPEERPGNPYFELGVAVDSTTEEVSSKFRTLAKALHPDRNPSAEAAQRFRDVQRCYDMLKTDAVRDALDEDMLGKAGPEHRERLMAQIEKRKRDAAARHHVHGSRGDAGGAAGRPAAAGAGASPAAAAGAAVVAAGAGAGAAPKGAKGGEPRAADASETQFVGDRLVVKPPNRDRTWSSQVTDTLPEDARVLDRALKSSSLLCDRCQTNVKAIFCIECGLDLCISCVSALHADDTSRLHKRLPMERKVDFMAKAQEPDTAEFLQMRRHKTAVGEALEKIRMRKEEEERAAAAAAALEAERAAAARAQAEADNSKLVLLDKNGRPVDVVVTNDEVRSHGTSASGIVISAESPAQEEVDLLRKGVEMLKVPRSGQPRMTRVFLREAGAGGWELAWESSKKKDADACVNLKGASLVMGQHTDVFLKALGRDATLKDRADISFSLESPKRSIDLVCQNRNQHELWTRVISLLIAMPLAQP